MKTTIEIADSLLDQAREFAVRENTTLRALVEAHAIIRKWEKYHKNRYMVFG